MAFKDLQNEELAEIAEFFVVDVVAANPDKPTKKELVAALASGEQPVTWEDYTTIFQPAKAAGKLKNPEVVAMEAAAEEARLAEEQRLAEIAALEAEEGEVEEKTVVTSTTVVEPTKAEEEKVVVKFERKNPRFDIAGITFTQSHPYARVDQETAQFIMAQGGFRPAMPQEVAEYYGVSR